LNVSEGEVGLHIYHTPLIIYLWIGGAIALIGAGIAAWPAGKQREAQAAAGLPVTGK